MSISTSVKPKPESTRSKSVEKAKPASKPAPAAKKPSKPATPAAPKDTAKIEPSKAGKAPAPLLSGLGANFSAKPAATTAQPAATADKPAAAADKPAEANKAAAAADKPAATDKAAAATDKPAEADKAAAATDKPAATDKAAAATDKPAEADKAATAADKPAEANKAAAAADKPAEADKAAAATDKPAATDKAAAAADKPAEADKAAAAADKPAEADKAAAATDKPAAEADKPAATDKPAAEAAKPADTLANQVSRVGDKLDPANVDRFADLVKSRFPGVDPKEFTQQFLKDNVGVHVVDFFDKAQGADVDGDGKLEKVDAKGIQVGSHGDTISRLYEQMGFKNVNRFAVKPGENTGDTVQRFLKEGNFKKGDIVSLSLGSGLGDEKLPPGVESQLASPAERQAFADNKFLPELKRDAANPEKQDTANFVQATREMQKQGLFVIGAGSNSGPGTFNPATVASDVITAPVGPKGNPLESASRHAGTTSGLGRLAFEPKLDAAGKREGVGVVGDPKVTFPAEALSGDKPLVDEIQGTPVVEALKKGTVEKVDDMDFRSDSGMEPATLKSYVKGMGDFFGSGLSFRQDDAGKLVYDPTGTRKPGDNPVADVSGASEVPPAIAERLVQEVQTRF